jgi:hypothetical protein
MFVMGRNSFLLMRGLQLLILLLSTLGICSNRELPNRGVGGVVLGIVTGGQVSFEEVLIEIREHPTIAYP